MMRFSLALLAALILAQPVDAAISFFGGASTPADNGSQNAAAARSVTPPGSMVANDYVIVIMTTNNATATGQSHSNSTTGGQTWTQETQCVGTEQSASTTRTTIFHARYNGTWAADPAFSSTNGSNGLSLVMLVFRGVDTTTAIDTALTCSALAIPGSPFDTTITGINTSNANAMVIAIWSHLFADTYTVQTGGWTQSNPAQFRNTSGFDQSNSYAYKIQASAGATGDVTTRMQGGAGGSGIIFALKEQAGGAVPTGLLRRRSGQ